MQYLAEAMLHGHMSYGRAGDADMSQAVHMPQVPLLTNGEMVLHYFYVDTHKPFRDPSLWVCFPFYGVIICDDRLRNMNDLGCRLMTFLLTSMHWYLLSWVGVEKGFPPFLSLTRVFQVSRITLTEIH